MNEEVIKDLKAAREVVSRGWHKGSESDGKGNFCALAAVSIATGGSYDEITDHKRFQMVVDALLSRLGSKVKHDVAAFNDDPETTHQDVLNLFDKALADLGGLA